MYCCQKTLFSLKLTPLKFVALRGLPMSPMPGAGLGCSQNLSYHRVAIQLLNTPKALTWTCCVAIFKSCAQLRELAGNSWLYALCKAGHTHGSTTIRLWTFHLRHFVYRHFVCRHFVYYCIPAYSRVIPSLMKNFQVGYFYSSNPPFGDTFYNNYVRQISFDLNNI